MASEAQVTNMVKTVLLTGGMGFIGSHTVEYILDKTNWNIVVIDSLSYAADIKRLTDLNNYDPARVQLFWHDLRAPINERLNERIGHVDFVINMASESHVDNSIKYPIEFVSSNVSLVLNMLEWARTRDLESFIQISTDEVYGAAPLDYSHSEWDAIIPSNPYSASKAAQEAIAISYWRTYGVPLIITNTMNNYGQRQHKEKFIPVVIRSVLDNKPIPVFAKHANDIWDAGSRVWLHAKNHADALIWLLTNKPPQSFFDGAQKPDRYNVAGDRDIKNDELAILIGDILNKKAILDYQNFHDVRPGHDLRYSLDNNKLDKLGWKPPINFDVSLEETVRWTANHKEWL